MQVLEREMKLRHMAILLFWLWIASVRVNQCVNDSIHFVFVPVSRSGFLKEKSAENVIVLTNQIIVIVNLVYIGGRRDLLANPATLPMSGETRRIIAMSRRYALYVVSAALPNKERWVPIAKQSVNVSMLEG